MIGVINSGINGGMIGGIIGGILLLYILGQKEDQYNKTD